jgi:hypothetical protein
MSPRRHKVPSGIALEHTLATWTGLAAPLAGGLYVGRGLRLPGAGDRQFLPRGVWEISDMGQLHQRGRIHKDATRRPGCQEAIA